MLEPKFDVIFAEGKSTMKSRINPHRGSSLDSLLEEEGMLEHCEAVAIKRNIAFSILDALKEQNLTQADLARKMNTSKAAINRLLNPRNTSITLHTLLKAASTLGKKVNLTWE